MPEGETIESSKPTFSEIFKGKDVALGEEIVDNLVSEGIALPVYYFEPGKRTTEVTVDRQPGEESYSLTEKPKRENVLLGAFIKSGEGEYIYLGIRESGFVVRLKDTKIDRFDTKRNTSYETNSSKLRASWSIGYYGHILFSEDENPEEFNRLTVAAVETARAEETKSKERRVEVRSNLKRALFGTQK